MKNRLIIIITIINILFVCTYVYADDEDFEEEIGDSAWIYEQIEHTDANNTNEPTINSRSAIIYDRVSGETIWGKDENSRRKMASTTKIMTAMIVIENVKDLSEVVVISNKAAGIGGSRLGLATGNKISVNDLLYGLMLKSGNDCAIALAECVGGNVDNFVDKMNEKAKELGLTQTHFVTVNGLDAEEHYTSALELAKITNFALNNKKFKEVVGTKSHTVTINGHGKIISNTNELLGNLNGVYGVKTGFTNGANRCLVTAVKRGNMDIICIVLGADTKKDRTKDSIKIIEYAFANYTMLDIESKIKEGFEEWNNTNNIAIIKGIENCAQIELKDYSNKILPINKNNIDKISISIESLKILEAPIHKGTKIGEVKLKIDNQTKISVDLIIAKEIKKKNEKDYLEEILKNYNNYFYKLNGLAIL